MWHRSACRITCSPKNDREGLDMALEAKERERVHKREKGE